MKKLIGLSLALAMATSLAGCDTPQGQNAAGGAVMGGATGALLGAALTGRPGGAVIGGVTGAATGAMVASAMTPQDPGYRAAPASLRGVLLRLLRQSRLQDLLLIDANVEARRVFLQASGMTLVPRPTVRSSARSCPRPITASGEDSRGPTA